MKDEQIVGLYWDRNEDAIRQTQLKYGSYLSKVADNILANLEDSQECVNDTYLAGWNSMPTNRPNVLSTYLGKIIRQISIDVYRKKNRQKLKSKRIDTGICQLIIEFNSVRVYRSSMRCLVLCSAQARAVVILHTNGLG